MLARIGVGDTTQWTVMEWVWEQAEHLPSANHVLVLSYLASKAFYTSANPEKGEVGQVMRACSYTSAIMKATGIKTRNTVRAMLNDLQDRGYIQREERHDKGLYGQQPHRIYVLWEYDEMREDIRAGKPLPMFLRMRPEAPARKPAVMAEVIPISLGINSGGTVSH
jgi:hypothetical protein